MLSQLVTCARSQVAPMSLPRGGLTLSAVGNCLFAIGGYAKSHVVGMVEVFNTETQVWNQVTEMPKPRDEHCAAVSGDRIYVFGGWRQMPHKPVENELTDVEYYEVSTDTWRAPPQPMKLPRRQCAATVT